jgi:hypothetical protein
VVEEKGLHWRNVRKIEIHSTRSTNTGVCYQGEKGAELEEDGPAPPHSFWVCLLGYTQWWVKRIWLQSIESCPTRRSYIFFSVVFEFFGWPVFSFFGCPVVCVGFLISVEFWHRTLRKIDTLGVRPPSPTSVESSSGFASISFQVKMRKKWNFYFYFLVLGEFNGRLGD